MLCKSGYKSVGRDRIGRRRGEEEAKKAREERRGKSVLSSPTMFLLKMVFITDLLLHLPQVCPILARNSNVG